MTHKIHILLVDDEASLREPLADYLIRQGYKVQQASDASVARSLLNAYDFDIILLDIMMPGEDGLSLCRFVTDKTDIPVIFISARTARGEHLLQGDIPACREITQRESLRSPDRQDIEVLSKRQNNVNGLLLLVQYLEDLFE